EDGFFPLPFDREVHVGGIQGRLRIQRRKVTTPDYGYPRSGRPKIPANLHGGDHLRAGHHRNRNQLDLMGGDNSAHGLGGIGIQVTVNDDVIFLALQDCRDGQYREREAAVLRPHGAWMEKNNHRRTKTSRRWSAKAGNNGSVSTSRSMPAR